jgi:hypothetical protein
MNYVEAQMRVKKAKGFKKTFDCPTETPGSKIARQNREKANSMTEEERQKHFNRGMQIIYGGSYTKQTAGVRR